MEVLDTIDRPDDVRALVQRTLARRPEDGFTAVSLARTLALPVAAVRKALLELSQMGLAVAVDDEFVSALQPD